MMGRHVLEGIAGGWRVVGGTGVSWSLIPVIRKWLSATIVRIVGCGSAIGMLAWIHVRLVAGRVTIALVIMTFVRVCTSHQRARVMRAEWVVNLGTVGAMRVVSRGAIRGRRVVIVGRFGCAIRKV